MVVSRGQRVETRCFGLSIEAVVICGLIEVRRDGESEEDYT